MSPAIDLRVVRMLASQVQTSEPRNLVGESLVRFENEKAWLLNELGHIDRATYPDNWWSDTEYDWFINRILDHLGAPR